MDKFLHRWHRFLGLRIQHPSWYRARFLEELFERHEARTWCHKLSESADVFYVISRSQHDGHSVGELPRFPFLEEAPIYLYMIPKCTSRWMFYQTAAFICSSPRFRQVREVVNPARDHKLREVAARHQIDADKFVRVCHRLRHFWIFLP